MHRLTRKSQTARRACGRHEGPSAPFDDGSRTVILNARGDLAHASPELAELLEYVGTGKCRRKGGLARALLDALGADGRGIEDLAEAIMHGTVDDLYSRYGIE